MKFYSAVKILNNQMHQVLLKYIWKWNKIILFQLRQPRAKRCLLSWSVGGSEKILFVGDEMSMQTWQWTELLVCKWSDLLYIDNYRDHHWQLKLKMIDWFLTKVVKLSYKLFLKSS